MLKISGLHTYYSRAHILDGIDLNVDKGECVAILGRNGAGKSTLMKTVMGLVPTAEGGISFEERDISRLDDYKISQAGIGYVPEERRIFAGLTVLENLVAGARNCRKVDAPWSIDDVYDLFPKLHELKDRQAGYLSGGEQQMLTVARTLMGNPKFLLLDEPTEGLAPIIVQKMIAAMKVLKDRGLSILISEQNQWAISPLCDRVYILEVGKVVYTGTMKELETHKDISDKYLSMH